MLYEIAEQMGWRLPDWIIYPTGGGTGIVGMRKAYDEMRELGLVDDPLPRFVVAQMAGCAPIVRAFEPGAESAEPWVGCADPGVGPAGAVRRSRTSSSCARCARARRGGGGRGGGDRGMMERAAREEGMLIGPEGAASLLALEALAQVRPHRAGAARRGVPDRAPCKLRVTRDHAPACVAVH